MSRCSSKNIAREYLHCKIPLTMIKYSNKIICYIGEKDRQKEEEC
jgi:hypothetical protein